MRAVGQTLFPRDRIVDVDGEDAGVVAYIDGYLARQRTIERLQWRAVLQGIELGFGVWSRRPGARFSRARPEDRAAYLEAWEATSNYTQRQIWEGFRGLFTFAYVDSLVVQDAAGIDERTAPAPELVQARGADRKSGA